LFGCCWLFLIGLRAIVGAVIFNDSDIFGDDGVLGLVAGDVNVDNGVVDDDEKSDDQS